MLFSLDLFREVFIDLDGFVCILYCFVFWPIKLQSLENQFPTEFVCGFDLMVLFTRTGYENRFLYHIPQKKIKSYFKNMFYLKRYFIVILHPIKPHRYKSITLSKY